MNIAEIKTTAKKVWHFIWEEDSALSWIVNVILAFIIIKFLVYPALGFVLGTTHPIVAVVSGSMEHRIADDGFGKLTLCDKVFTEKQSTNFDFYWNSCGTWYENMNISKSEFQTFIFNNGFNIGDIIVILGTPVDKLKIGDVIVYNSIMPDPIIHRIVKIWQNNGVYMFQTKGDHNQASFSFESGIAQSAYVGRAVFKIPYLGYIKIFAVDIWNYLTSFMG